MRSSSAALVAPLLLAIAAASCAGSGARGPAAESGPGSGSPGESAQAGESTQAGESAQAGEPTPAGERGAAGEPPPGRQSPPRIVQPGAPGEPSRLIGPDEATDLSGIRHTAADVRFMQGMIHHHAQALEMTALVPERAASEGVRRLAQRIELSQVDEIGMMEVWLRQRGETVPPDHARAHGMMMPGMLTAQEMSRLEAAGGTEFDRLFLEGMIQHHGGALIMVDELFATAGAGQEPTINAFASEIVADQRAEMDRMAAMLDAMDREP